MNDDNKYKEIEDINAEPVKKESGDNGKKDTGSEAASTSTEKEVAAGTEKETSAGTEKETSAGNSANTNPSDSSNSKNSDYEDVCFACRRPESKTGPMIRLMNDIPVCQDCMKRVTEMMSQFDYQGMFTPTANGTFFGNPDMKVDDDEEGDGKKGSKDGSGGFPRFSFINLANLQGDGGIPNKQKLKKKKKHDTPIIDIKNIPPPHKIRASLDEYVIGQDHAKKVISVAVYNHYKRVATNSMDNIEIEKSNMLMIGPTGSGKTYLVKTLARLLDVPLAIADATSLTEAGYIGDDIESVISKLLAAADNDVERAEKGIVFIDEIDKIAKKANANARDVSGESVQQGMLKLLEGADVEVPVGASSKGAMVPLATVNTRNILFICGGAFPDLEDIIKERLTKNSLIGFGATLKNAYEKEDILAKVKVEDIRKFGMIPEFIGRLPIIFTLQSLTKEMMIRILKEPKNAILKQYQKLLELDEVKLDFSEDALEAIADKAMEQDTGARALRSIIEEFMLDIMYEIPKDDNIGTVTITGDYIRGTGGPVIGLRGSDPLYIEDHGNTEKSSETQSEGSTDTDPSEAGT